MAVFGKSGRRGIVSENTLSEICFPGKKNSSIKFKENFSGGIDDSGGFPLYNKKLMNLGLKFKRLIRLVRSKIIYQSH